MGLFDHQKRDRELWERYFAEGKPIALRNELVERNIGIAYKAANRHADRFELQNHDREEVISIAALLLIDAVESFDPSAGVQFSTWAMNNAKWSGSRFEKKRTAAGCAKVHIVPPFDEEGEISFDPPSSCDVVRDVLQNESQRLQKRVWSRARRRLSKRDYGVLKMWMSGSGRRLGLRPVIARKFGVSASSVSKIVQKSIETLKDAFTDAEYADYFAAEAV